MKIEQAEPNGDIRQVTVTMSRGEFNIIMIAVMGCQELDFNRVQNRLYNVAKHFYHEKSMYNMFKQMYEFARK